MTPDEEIVRAGQAREIVESSLWQEAKHKIEDGIRNQMLSVSSTDLEMQARLVSTLKIWNQLERYFQSIVESGRMAEYQVEQDRKKRFWG
jgi:hypothetical protein